MRKHIVGESVVMTAVLGFLCTVGETVVMTEVLGFCVLTYAVRLYLVLGSHDFRADHQPTSTSTS
jgi:hypothetical protein